MLLIVMKHGGHWDFLARVFHCKVPNFEKMIVRFCQVIAPFLYEEFVVLEEENYTVHRLLSRNRSFKTYPCARYETDVWFQQSYRPSGLMREVHPWYSGKHKLHGYKFEASVLCNGVCISYSDHVRGGRSDLEILK